MVGHGYPWHDHFSRMVAVLQELQKVKDKDLGESVEDVLRSLNEWYLSGETTDPLGLRNRIEEVGTRLSEAQLDDIGVRLRELADRASGSGRCGR